MSIKSKGSKIQKDIAATFTDFPGLVQFSTDGVDVETYDDSELDQAAAGRAKAANGFANGGNVTGSLWFDPVDAVVQSLTDSITTPGTQSYKIIWSDALSTEWPFSGIFKGLNVAADMATGLLASWSIEVNGLITYPT